MSRICPTENEFRKCVDCPASLPKLLQKVLQWITLSMFSALGSYWTQEVYIQWRIQVLYGFIATPKLIQGFVNWICLCQSLHEDSTRPTRTVHPQTPFSGFFVSAFENNHSHRSYFLDQVHSLAHWMQVKTRMPTTAREFQVVLSTIKEWYLLSFHALLMNGQLAIEDASYNLEPYVFMYCSKRQLYERIGWPNQGSRHHTRRIAAAFDVSSYFDL